MSYVGAVKFKPDLFYVVIRLLTERKLDIDKKLIYWITIDSKIFVT